MNSGSLLYQKGDLVTMKQASLVCQTFPSGDGDIKRSFRQLNKPMNGVFLGFLERSIEDDAEELTYLQRACQMRTPCRIAVGDSIYYIDEKSFFFHNQRS